ncbi:MAG: hypothetical protein EOO28_27190 [Comamonadaceae bacterium]|nr:MAG: hypothetical protein EOO28_27190 [Comamonadaceae bacterium]
MKSVLLLALAAALLTGCIAVPYDNGRYYRPSHSGYYGNYGDRDRDGVPDNVDRRPGNPRRY